MDIFGYCKLLGSYYLRAGSSWSRAIFNMMLLLWMHEDTPVSELCHKFTTLTKFEKAEECVIKSPSVGQLLFFNDPGRDKEVQ